MKVIFLDFDGVLNSYPYDCQRTSEQGNIDETRLPLLKSIVDAIQAKIVLSSSWRKHWNKDKNLCDTIGREIESLFSKYNLTIFDKTPELSNNDREKEIKLWLNENKAVSRFVILDDMLLGFGNLQEYLVNTNYRIGRGLEKIHVEKAIKLLNE